MASRGEHGFLHRREHGRWCGWLVAGSAALFLAGCAALPRGVGQAPRVFDLETVPPKTVLAGCPVTVSFQAESQVDLVHAKVTWRVKRIVGKRALFDHWYAILPINSEAPVSRTHGIVALQLRPRDEGTYDYAVEVEDTEGVRSNVLTTTVIVEPRVRDTPCPPADPIRPTHPKTSMPQ
jgi:hypothetical protein